MTKHWTVCRASRAAITLGVFALAFSPPDVRADPPAETKAKPAPVEKDWAVDVTPFLWIAGMSGQIGVGDSLSPANVGFLDILENLKGTAMASASVRYRRLGLMADGVWLRVDTSGDVAGALYDDSKVTMNTAFGTGAAFFRFEPKPGLTIDPYVGARWWRIDTELELSGGVAAPFSGEQTIRWADPVFGFRLGYAITDRWFVQAIGDVGGGVAKYEWQALGATGYRFTDWFALQGAYRIVGVKYVKDGFTFDQNVSGPLFGLTFRI